jgi:hypothetical protein
MPTVRFQSQSTETLTVSFTPAEQRKAKLYQDFCEAYGRGGIVEFGSRLCTVVDFQAPANGEITFTLKATK